MRYVVRKYLTAAGIRKRASVHTLRHTYGTHKYANGMTIPELQELIGANETALKTMIPELQDTTLKYIHLAQTNLGKRQEQTAL